MVSSAMPNCVELVQHLADVLVVGHHHVVVEPLAALTHVLVGAVRPEVHGRRVVPEEEGLVRLVRVVDEAQGVRGHFLVDGLHALLGEWTGILDLLSALAIRPAVQHTARSKRFLNAGSFG